MHHSTRNRLGAALLALSLVILATCRNPADRFASNRAAPSVATAAPAAAAAQVGGKSGDNLPLVRSIRLEKAAEANEMLDLIKKGAAVYYTTPRVARDTGIKVPCQFPRAVALTPSGGSCCDPRNDADGDHRCDSKPGNWNDPTWSALKFAITDQHYFQYKIESSGTMASAKMTVTAYADLDCDTILSTFQLVISGDPNATMAECDQIGPSAIFRDNETE